MRAHRAFEVTLRFSDGIEERIQVACGKTVLEAALEANIALVHQCQSGSCSTCMGRLVTGATEKAHGRSLALLPSEISDGMQLTCSVHPAADSTFEFDYPSALVRAAKTSVAEAHVVSVKDLSRSIILLELELAVADFSFASGQYVRIRVPGTDQWRSYSMTTTERELPRLKFLVRYIEGGVMSEFLKRGGAIGNTVEVIGPLGSFCLANTTGRHLMIAGGSGLAPIMAMLDEVRLRSGPKPSVVVCFGCNSESDLFFQDELQLRAFWMPYLNLRIAVMERPASGFKGHIGTAVSLLEKPDMDDVETVAYVCGPPAMVETARCTLISGGIKRDNIHTERFRATAT